MAFSLFLESRKDDCKALVTALRKHFDYVSILGTDVKCKVLRSTRSVSNIGEGRDSECGFVLKMTSGKSFYEYSFDDVKGDVDDLVKKIIEETKIHSSLVDKQINGAPVADQPLVKDFVRESDIHNYDDKTLMEFCAKIKDDVLAQSDKFVNAIAMLSIMEVNKLFVSENKMLTQNYAWVNSYAIGVYREGNKMVTPREGVNTNMLSEVFENLPKKVEILLKKAENLAKATPIEPGVYDVITHPSITGLIAHEAFGHGVEMDMFVKDRALAKSYVGKYVASPITNMRDGAASCYSVGSYFFDDDGVLAHDTQIIKDGILVAGISDLATAGVLGTEPTGNGRRESYKRKAYSRMTNTFFEKGSDKLEDMIASIKHGYMLFETNNGMEDPKSWAIQCVAEYGIEIIDGKLTDHYVSPVVMSGYVPDLLKSISMISDDFVVEGSGSCGKGYKEWVRVSDGGPALKVRVKLG